MRWKKKRIRFRWSKVLVPLLSSCLMWMGCEDEAGEVEEEVLPGVEEVDEVAPVEEIEPGLPVEEVEGARAPGGANLDGAALARVDTLTRSVVITPKPPPGVEGDEATVNLTFVNYPGYVETIHDAALAQCAAKLGPDPFAITYRKYVFADAKREPEIRVLRVDACPDWPADGRPDDPQDLEAGAQAAANAGANAGGSAGDGAGAATDTAARTSPAVAGWAGRGFYRIPGDTTGESPLDEGWKTFCGETSGTPCTGAMTRRPE